ncbi:MAG: hypothetical protein HPM95_15285 [Alphaproteobacteria bacterium]|nr:hypothetical protein [Alphaproteobacteria bacterium]
MRKFGATLNSGTTAETEQHLNSLSPEESSQRRDEGGGSLPGPSRVAAKLSDSRSGYGRCVFRQRDCVWVRAIGNRHHQSATADTRSFREVTTGVAGAFQKEVFDDTFVEVGGTRSEFIDVSGRSYSQSGSRFSAGVAFQARSGHIHLLSTTVGGGVYDLDQTRRYVSGGTAHSASADVRAAS